MFAGKAFDDVDGAFLKEIMKYDEPDLKAFADSVRRGNSNKPTSVTKKKKEKSSTVKGLSPEELKSMYEQNKAILKELKVK